MLLVGGLIVEECLQSIPAFSKGYTKPHTSRCLTNLKLAKLIFNLRLILDASVAQLSKT